MPRVIAVLSLMALNLALNAGEATPPSPLDEKRKELLSRIGDPENAESLQALAAREAIALGVDDPLATAILDKITHKTSTAMAKGLVVELGRSSYAPLGAKLIERWLLLPIPTRQAAVPILFTRPGWTDALLDGLYNGKIESTELTPDQIHYLLNHPVAKVAERARAFFGGRKLLPNPDRASVLASFEGIFDLPTDVRAGARVFEQHCSRCHRNYETGSHVGPELTGAHLREKKDLLAAILDPARKIDERYKPIAQFMKDGRLLAGLASSKNEHVVEMLQIQGGVAGLSVRDIERTEPLNFSLMPPGFERLEGAALNNLIAYLTHLPAIFPLPLGNAATASSARPMFDDKDPHGVFVFGRWGSQRFDGVYFNVVDADGGARKNAIVLHSSKGNLSNKMPKTVAVPCKSDALALHFLGGIAGFGFPNTPAGSVSMTVRLHYADATTEDHVWKNGEQIAAMAKTAEVPQSKKAYEFREQQLRYLTIKPQRPTEKIDRLEFIKGADDTAPVILAITVERAPIAAPVVAPPAPAPIDPVGPQPTKKE